jgi:hypothetical protein
MKISKAVLVVLGLLTIYAWMSAGDLSAYDATLDAGGSVARGAYGWAWLATLVTGAAVAWTLYVHAVNRPRCPECRGTVPAEASRCRHCGVALERQDEINAEPRRA